MWTLSTMCWVWGWGMGALAAWGALSTWEVTWSHHRVFNLMVPPFMGAIALAGIPSGHFAGIRGGLLLVWVGLLFIGSLLESRGLL